MKSETLQAYENFVENFIELHQNASKIELGQYSAQPTNGAKSDKKILLFSPHPDDECVIGALPLRLQQELNAKVINVAVTLGSNKERQLDRLQEAKNACSSLGFDIILPEERGLENISLESKLKDPEKWQEKVQTIKEILIAELPDMIFYPHGNDYNSTHIGVNILVNDAIQEIISSDQNFQTTIIETEFWQMMDAPNLLIGLTKKDEARLIYALSAHTGEVQRNPYHINHPARMLDNITRGAEVVGGQGEAAPEMDFAMIYRHSKVKQGKIIVTKKKKCFGTKDNLAELF